MKFEELLVKCIDQKNEIEAAKCIKSYLEKEAIDATIQIKLNGYEITISPFKNISIKKIDDEIDLKVSIKGELDKKYENLLNFLFFNFLKRRENELKLKIKSLIKGSLKREEIDEFFDSLEEKERRVLERDPLFYLFFSYRDLLKNLEKKSSTYQTYTELLNFAFFKIINCEREEHLQEILFYILRRILKDKFEFFFLFFEDSVLPLNTMFSSNFLDEFFYEDLCRNKIKEGVNRVRYKNKELHLFYSRLIESELGALGIYTDEEIDYEMSRFFEYISVLTLYFFLKGNIKFSYDFTKKLLPVINVKALLLKYKKKEELIENLTSPLKKLDIVEIIKKVLSTLEFEILRKKIRINIEREEFFCEGDRDLLEIAFLYLFRYLISFNRIRGFINIYFKEGEIQIEDSGIGMTDRDLNLILDPQDIEEDLSVVGIIFKTLGYYVHIEVEKGIGNKIRITF
ncbi:MAG: hypothetical protein ABDH49_05620 [Candidatus Hydrothermales bacterium]